MKMLTTIIVDDEPNHLIGLDKHISWSKLGYKRPMLAEDAQEALQIAKEQHIDVLIADVCMPGIDGIELVNRIRGIYPDIYVLIISGHEEFEFARGAVEAGAQAYLLKPLKIDEVEHWLKVFYDETMTRLKLIESEQVMKKKFRENLVMARARFMEELLFGFELNPEKIKNQLQCLDLPEDNFIYRIAIISLDNYEFIKNKDPVYASDIMLRLSNAVRVVFSSFFCIILRIHANHLTVLLLKEQNYEYLGRDEIDRLLMLLRKSLYNDKGILLSISVSKQSDRWEHACFLYRNAFNVLTKGRTYGEGNTFWTDDFHEINKIDMENVDFFRESIAACIKQIDAKQLNNLIEMMFNFLAGEKNMTVSFVQSISLEIVSNVQQLSEVTGFTLPVPYINMCQMVLNSTSINDLREKMKDVIVKYIISLEEFQNKKKSQTMEVIVDYIGKNLRNGVTVNELADVVYMNPSYLSVLFKKEMGETITEYINRVRIDKAKKMLQQVNFKIYDIAQELGYQNPSYFAFQFKKSTGYTPAEYRRVVNHKSTTR